ncbi:MULTISPECIES: LysR family transcriptional regulator [Paraburkholderia]|uniref:LysR family transcriptional regulator n=1 Tax=Paraburkholderia TaxID=1822464 RepID=UPI002AB6DF7C|nr:MULTISPECIES: LysR family transcriptional regulator [Paraburkholderia]
MDTRQLLLAIRLAETLHFGKAAEIENVAQSGLSAQIAKLESELGFAIFERTNRRVVVTEAGKSFIERAREMLGDMSNTIIECRALAEKSRGVLKLGFFGEAAGELTHLMLGMFRRVNPNIQLVCIELSMTNQVQALVSGRVDAALLRLPIDDDRLAIDVMYDEPRVAVIPADHPMADASLLEVSDLFGQPFAVAAAGAPSEWASYWCLEPQYHERTRVGAFVQSIPESLAAVAYSGACDTFPLSATRVFSHPGVRYVPLKDAPRSALALVTLKQSRNAAVRSLRQCISQTLDSSLSRMPEACRGPK